MKNLFWLVFMVGTLISESRGSVSIVWSEADGGNGHVYELTALPDNWISSEAWAVAQGGHLVSINSAAEQAFVQTNFLVGDFASKPLWIGLTDIYHGAGSGDYSTWTTGEKVTYTNWNPASTDPELPQEPNNLNGIEDYVALNWHFSFGYHVPMGTWNDIPLNGITGFDGRANGPHFGIVEIVPEPSTTFLLAFSLLGASWFYLRKQKSAAVS